MKPLMMGLALFATSAAAQQPTFWGTQGEHTRMKAGSAEEKAAALKEFNRKETRLAHARFGTCVVKRFPREAAMYVATPRLDDDTYAKVIKKLANGECLGLAVQSRNSVQMTFPGDTMRYALADPLVRKLSAKVASVNFKDVPPLRQRTLEDGDYLPAGGGAATPEELKLLERRRAIDMANIFMSTFGECVVRTEPVGTRALLMTEVETAQEHAAFQALAPAFGGCMQAGQSRALDKHVLRGTLAMNVYRLAQASGAAGASR